ncbi:MAG: hypothetical protein BGO98_14475 [Myxococcales bacterium 68-20]|nr:MAG: hypothetical protein BGO98_14475 [Myxococcales bacterium 68-20]
MLTGRYPAATRAAIDERWIGALEAARSLTPPRNGVGGWRERSARRRRRSSPPCSRVPLRSPSTRRPRSAPPSAHGIVEEVHYTFLARIERSDGRIKSASAAGSKAYAPLAETRSRALAAKLRREVLAPRGSTDSSTPFSSCRAIACRIELAVRLANLEDSREAHRAGGDRTRINAYVRMTKVRREGILAMC